MKEKSMALSKTINRKEKKQKIPWPKTLNKRQKRDYISQNTQYRNVEFTKWPQPKTKGQRMCSGSV